LKAKKLPKNLKTCGGKKSSFIKKLFSMVVKSNPVQVVKRKKVAEKSLTQRLKAKNCV